MISPHPVYSTRGTPISVFNRCAALGALGHNVDLITYPLGENKPAPGLTYIRARVPGIDEVKVGPSLAKIPLNIGVAVKAALSLLKDRSRYDVIHSHEEAGLIGWPLSVMSRLPHVYDMGNDWGVVLENYGLSHQNPINAVARAAERSVVKSADVVIAHFPQIAEEVSKTTTTPVEVVTNIALEAEPDPHAVRQIRDLWASDGIPFALYAGTLEPYQGIGMLIEAVANLIGEGHALRLVIMGGRDEQIRAFRQNAFELGIGNQVLFTGPQPSETVTACLSAADVLVSPRATGTNTPLKIFSYLRAGRPIVATDITSHTQVLDDSNAVIVPPDAKHLAKGLLNVLTNSETSSGEPRSDDRYSPKSYLQGVAQAYEHVGAPTSPTDLEVAAERLRSWMKPTRIRPDLPQFSSKLTTDQLTDHLRSNQFSQNPSSSQKSRVQGSDSRRLSNEKEHGK